MMITGAALAGGALDQAGELFADHRPHAAAHEAKVHDSQGDGQVVQVAKASFDGVDEASFVLGFADAIAVGLAIAELEGVNGAHNLIHGRPGALIDELLNALIAVDADVMIALEAHHLVGLEVFGVGQNAAGLAFVPQAVCNFPLLAIGADRTGLLTIRKPIK